MVDVRNAGIKLRKCRKTYKMQFMPTMKLDYIKQFNLTVTGTNKSR